MADWTYTERDATTEDLPEVPRPAEVPVFTVTDFPLRDRKRVYLANGVIGLRLPAVPFLKADVAVSGLVGRSIADGMESAAPAPYPCQADIVVGHDRLSERPDLLTVREQRLDMAWGELETRLAFNTKEAKLDIEVLTFVPRTLPTAICQEIAVTPDRDCELQLHAMIDPAGLPPDFQRVVDSAFFYLHSSVQRCTPGSLPPFGLSRTEGYYHGHVFVDHEHVMFHPLLLTAPDAARATLDYRLRYVPMARMNALCQGTAGILFPWQSGMVGDEVSTPHATGCVMEFANPAIADAFLKYAHASGDELFLREDAWPVLRGVADWISTRVTKTARGYEVRNNTASESFENTHNEPDTNRRFAALLREAIGLAERFGIEPPRRWGEVADNILILTDPADLARETAAGDLKRQQTLSVVEDANLPWGSWGNHGTGMTPSALAGDRELAAEYARASIEAHWQPDFGGWREYGQYWNYGQFEMDCFVSQTGSLLKELLLGLPRLTIGPGSVKSWCGGPISLPAGWETIEVERLWVRGKPTRLVARHGAERAELDSLQAV